MSAYQTQTWAPLSPLAHPRVVEIRTKLEATRARFVTFTTTQERFIALKYGEYSPTQHTPDYGDGEIYGNDGLPVAFPDRDEDLLAPPAEEENDECEVYARIHRPMSLASHNVVFNCVSRIKPVDTAAFVKSGLAGRWSI